jgi:hypothetical protein
MDPGIINVRLVPSWNSPDVRRHLALALQAAQALRSAIAYCTVDADFLGPNLCSRLKQPHGYLCVDVHLPTDIDELAQLVRRGADVRIYCEEISPPKGDRDLRHLLHTKMLLFWMPDRTSELWVGSHNWTTRALTGLNAESSLVVKMHDSSGLFGEAAEYLERIKAICETFDLSRIELYKQLQRRSSERNVHSIEIETEEAESLEQSVATIFGSDPDELDQVRVLHEVYVSAFDRSGSRECIYHATVKASGLMRTEGISFPAQKYAFRHGKRFPELLTKREVSADVLRNAKYFVAIEIGRYEPSLQAFDPPVRVNAWDEVDPALSPLLRRLDPEEISVMFHGERPVVKRPGDQRTAAPRLALLGERRAMNEHRLIVPRIIRSRN